MRSTSSSEIKDPDGLRFSSIGLAYDLLDRAVAFCSIFIQRWFVNLPDELQKLHEMWLDKTRDNINRWTLRCENHVNSWYAFCPRRMMASSISLLATIMRSANSSTMTTISWQGTCLYLRLLLNSSTWHCSHDISHSNLSKEITIFHLIYNLAGPCCLVWIGHNFGIKR